MYNADGSFKEPFFFTAPARHCFIYTPVIAKSPAKYMWAGIGDTYAKYFEAEMSSRGEDLVHYHALGVTGMAIMTATTSASIRRTSTR